MPANKSDEEDPKSSRAGLFVSALCVCNQRLSLFLISPVKINLKMSVCRWAAYCNTNLPFSTGPMRIITSSQSSMQSIKSELNLYIGTGI